MVSRSSLSILGVAALFAFAAVARADTPQDPFLWLEDVHGARATAWVASEDAKTRAALERDPRFAGLASDSLHLLQANDRLPNVTMIVAGNVYEFRRSADHVRGIWRTTTAADFVNASPAWSTVLDLDALATTDKKNWVWQGADCDSTSETRCLISLSEGGEDASTIREFDLKTRRFVPGGFSLPHGKQDVAWIDDDTLLVSREWKPGEMTKSGYPYVTKKLARGQALDAATEIARGKPTDVSAAAETPQNAAGKRVIFIRRGVSFFETETQLQTPGGLVDVAFPRKSSILGLLGDRLLLSIDEPWTTGGASFEAGSLVSLDLAALEADPAHLVPTVVYAPGPLESLQSTSFTRDRLIVSTLDNVRGRAAVYTPVAQGGWTRTQLALPDDASVDLGAADDRGEDSLLSVTSFLIPTTIWHVDGPAASATVVKTAPTRFDASRDVVQQREAVSADGTHVPYFIVHPRDMNYDGTNPTILYAYGGFQVSLTPQYSSVLGKLWLANRGTYVLANIRGGGEFGPAWHDAGLKTHRQRVYDDFAAVAHDLIARKITTPRRLGIEGGSNGGLLMGVEFTQHPELWNAVDIQVPLLDMLRYQKIAAGSSWVGEYGSVDVPEERAFLEKISPYANLRPGVKYPEPLVWTTTKDDRVGPQHARKFAAALAALHDPYYFFEQTEGGHGSGANAKEDAEMDALEYTYFAEKLMD